MIADDNLPMYKNQSPFPGHANRRTYKNKALSPELQSKLCHQTLAPRLNTSAKSDKHLWTRVFQEEDCFQKNALQVARFSEIGKYSVHTAFPCNHRGWICHTEHSSNGLVAGNISAAMLLRKTWGLVLY